MRSTKRSWSRRLRIKASGKASLEAKGFTITLGVRRRCAAWWASMIRGMRLCSLLCRSREYLLRWLSWMPWSARGFHRRSPRRPRGVLRVHLGSRGVITAETTTELLTVLLDSSPVFVSLVATRRESSWEESISRIWCSTTSECTASPRMRNLRSSPVLANRPSLLPSRGRRRPGGLRGTLQT